MLSDDRWSFSDREFSARDGWKKWREGQPRVTTDDPRYNAFRAGYHMGVIAREQTTPDSGTDA